MGQGQGWGEWERVRKVGRKDTHWATERAGDRLAGHIVKSSRKDRGKTLQT